MSELGQITSDSPAALINRELSWLSFARRVLALAEDRGSRSWSGSSSPPIMGMIYDEFAMKRTGGLIRQARRGWGRRGPDGLTSAEVLKACRADLRSQQESVARLVEEQLRPALRDLGTPAPAPARGGRRTRCRRTTQGGLASACGGQCHQRDLLAGLPGLRADSQPGHIQAGGGPCSARPCCHRACTATLDHADIITETI